MSLERIRVSGIIPAVPPERVYQAWLDPQEHTAMTGSPASIIPRRGGRFTAHDGYITGKTIELEKGKRVVQSWRTSSFPEACDDSTIDVQFKPSNTGTRVVITHAAIPEGQGIQYQQGWLAKYFKPMTKYFDENPEGPPDNLPAPVPLAPARPSEKKTAAKKPAKKKAAKKAPAKKKPGKKKPSKKAPAKKKSAKKKPAKKSPAKKKTAKKKAAKKSAPRKKAPAKRPAAKKKAAKKKAGKKKSSSRRRR